MQCVYQLNTANLLKLLDGDCVKVYISLYNAQCLCISNAQAIIMPIEKTLLALPIVVLNSNTPPYRKNTIGYKQGPCQKLMGGVYLTQ